MKVIEREIGSVKPYPNNPRNNDDAVDAVAESIKQFGFKQPIVVDKDGVIIVGHTRLKAAEKLGLKKVPVLVAEDLNDEQVKAYRLADNKTNELASWDKSMLNLEIGEIGDIDMSLFGFGKIDNADWFGNDSRFDNDNDIESEEYQEFVEKFEPKKTTDDCYTPDNVYDAVADFVSERYGVKREKMQRPFFPGGDYRNEEYTGVVVDNPPFSIISEIVDFYIDNNVKFFLFCQTLTSAGLVKEREATLIVNAVTVTYANGANVDTSFITNLEKAEIRMMTMPELYERVRAANEANTKELTANLPSYEYPPQIVTAAMLRTFARYGIDYKLMKSSSKFVRVLDSQKEKDKAIFGGGFLVSEKAAAEKAAAEKAAAEKAAAEKAAAEKAAAEKANVEKWQLSERELEIVANLGKKESGLKAPTPC